MKIDYDPEHDEFFLKFIDEDDRKKKSRFLKRVFENKIPTITMSLSYKTSEQTVNQQGLYKAFKLLLKDYTGYEYSEVESLIYKNTDTTEEIINKYDKNEFSEFIEKLFKMCSEQIGINVQMVEGKLKIIPENV